MKAFFWRGIPVRNIILSARYQGKAAAFSTAKLPRLLLFSFSFYFTLCRNIIAKQLKNCSSHERHC